MPSKRARGLLSFRVRRKARFPLHYAGRGEASLWGWWLLTMSETFSLCVFSSKIIVALCANWTRTQGVYSGPNLWAELENVWKRKGSIKNAKELVTQTTMFLTTQKAQGPKIAFNCSYFALAQNWNERGDLLDNIKRRTPQRRPAIEAISEKVYPFPPCNTICQAKLAIINKWPLHTLKETIDFLSMKKKSCYPKPY